MAAAYVITGWWPLLAVLAYGFVARVLSGPRFSPLGLLVTRVVTPRLGLAPRLVPGPPKRFAQGIGAVVSTTALVLAVVADQPTAARAVVGVLIAAATLESAAGVCVGCIVFRRLMTWGLVPTQVCEACSDLTRSPNPGMATSR